LLHLLQIHFLPHSLRSWPSCDNHWWLSSDAGLIFRFCTLGVNAFICGV
jgi:hypothetical protein